MEIRKSSINWQVVVAVALIFIGVALRLVPHMPNFAPVGAIALFGGALLGWRTAVWLPLLVMILSDLMLGFYPGIQYTWAGFLLVALFGGLFRHARYLTRVVLGGIGGATLFFVVSNFGVWLSSGMYAHDIAGLGQCYTMALPFFRASLMADVFYAGVLFGIYELALYAIKYRSAMMDARSNA
jgi:hypothetical protein